MNNPNPEEKPKIVVDEDWKSQIAAEREKLKHEEEAQPQEQGAGDIGQLPEPSLSVLVQMLSAQALSALGQFPDPENEGRVVVHLEFAKLQIDLLGVLQQKTSGNCTPEESALMQETLDQLRLLFVEVQREVAALIARQQQQQGQSSPGSRPPQGRSSIELP